MKEGVKTDISDGNNQIRTGAVLSYASVVVNILAGLLYTPWMIKCIGSADYGLYTLAGSLISLFMVDFGLGAAVSKFISQYLAEGNQPKINNLLGIVYKLYLGIAVMILVAMIVLFLNSELVFTSLSSGEVQKLKIILLIVAAFNFISFTFVPLNGILTSYELFVPLKSCTLLNKVLTVAIMVVVLMLGGDVYSLVIVNTLVGLIVILIKLYFVSSRTPVAVSWRYWNKTMLNDVLGYSAWTTVISIFQRLIFNIMPTILAALSGSVSVAIFGIASAMEGYLFTVSDAINGLFLPKVSRIVASGSNVSKEVLSLMIKVGRINLFAVAFCTLAFIAFGKSFITLWVGSDFEDAYLITVLMILPDLIFAPQQIARTHLIAAGKVNYQAQVYVVIGTVNVIAAYFLCPIYGAIGAGLSICLAYTLRVVLMNRVYTCELNIDIKSFFLQCHWKLAPVLIIFSLSAILISQTTLFATWLTLLLGCLLYSFLFLLVSWFFCMNDFEKSLVKSLFQAIRCRLAK